MSTATEAAPVGSLLREWRTRRRVSQLELSSETGVSTPHLSFIETGPSGLRERIANFEEYSAHVIIRLQRQERATGDPAIRELIRECSAYPGVGRPRGMTHDLAPVLAIRLSASDVTLSFFTVVSTLGAPYDVTLD